jgi:hypothetical protein
MTSVFENRIEDPESFLRELAKDRAKGAVADDILRLAYRSQAGSYRQLDPHHMMAREGAKLGSWFRARFVEASYVARGQLTKLSAYCGLGFNAPSFEVLMHNRHGAAETARLSAQYQAIAAETEARLRDLVHRLQEAGAGLDLREGATFVEDGAWIADAESPIEPVPAPECADCLQPIYRIHGQWRHQMTRSVVAGELEGDVRVELTAGRAEGFMRETCPLCKGAGATTVGGRNSRCQRCLGMRTIQRLHHLADPLTSGRLV